MDEQVFKCIEQYETGMTMLQIVKRLKQPMGRVQFSLARLLNEGRITYGSHGRYVKCYSN